MSINILDDEVLKRNQQLISSIEDDKTSIETEEENKKTQFAVLYDGDPKKALEDARRNVEIDINSANNRTPTQNIENDPRTNEITFKGFDKGEGSTKWNKISEPNPGTTKTISDSKFRERQNLENAKEIIKSEFPDVVAEDNFKIVERIEEGESNLTYNKVYQNSFWSNNDWFGNRAKLPENPIRQVSVDTSDLEIRDKSESSLLGLPINENKLRELSIFVFMLFPYIGTDVALSARSAIEDPNIVGLATSGAANIGFALNNLRYFTAAELVTYFGHNFYSLYFLKRHSIKYPLKLWSGVDTNVREWDGAPDIFFGEEQVTGFLKRAANFIRARRNRRAFSETGGDGSQALTKLKDGPQQNSANEEGDTIPLSPQIFIENGIARTILIDEPTALLTEGVKNSQRDKEELASILPNGSIRGIVTQIPQFTFENGKWKRIESQRNFRFKDQIEGKSFRLIDINSLVQTGIQPANDIDALNRAVDNTFEVESPFINEEALKVANFQPFQYLDSDNIPSESETIEVAIQRRGRETNNINDLQIGSILVAPVVDEPFREVNNLPRFHIPFQFNPNISESGVEAKYEAVSVLSRIGELFSYSSTTSLTITLETEYIATTDNEINEVGIDGNNWMSFYTLEKLQAIEKAYRSLVLPHYPTENDLEQGYVYVKPPLLRVIIGGSNKEPGDSGPYANILTYGVNSMTDGIADSSGVVFSSNSRLKNFIATNVTIKKDLYENPIVLDKEGKVLDAMRFNVSLNLTEVSTNYLDSLPDYRRHSNTYLDTMPNFILATRSSGQEA